MSHFLSTAQKQFIDDCGRTRVLVYEDLCLFTPPIHPLPIPHFEMNDPRELHQLHKRIENVTEAEKYTSFVNESKFSVVSVCGEEGDGGYYIHGVWLEIHLESIGTSSDYYLPLNWGFVPSGKVPPHFKNVITKSCPDTWFISSGSISSSEQADMVMNILKQAAVRYYTDNLGMETEAGLGRLTPDHFFPDENLISSIVSRLKDRTKPMFFNTLDPSDMALLYVGAPAVQKRIKSNKKSKMQQIRVPRVEDEHLQKELIEALINFVDITRSDPVALRDYGAREIFIGDYRTASSYRQSPDFCVFETKGEIIKYKNTVSGGEYRIRKTPDPFDTDPQIVSNAPITHSYLAIVQNIESGEKDQQSVLLDVKCALMLWERERHNPGYYPVSEMIVQSLGDVHLFKLNIVREYGSSAGGSSDGLRPNALEYSHPDGTKSYAAILYL